MEEETMKPIDEFEGYYITNMGRVLCNRVSNRCKDGSMHEIKQKCGHNKQKYLNVICCNNNEQRTFMVHRLVAQYFVPGYFEGAVVNHIDGDNRNNKASNLEWITQRENIHKSYKTSHMGPRRHYIQWKFYSPSNLLLGIFDGVNEIGKFAEEHNLNLSVQSLKKYHCSKGYTIEKICS